MRTIKWWATANISLPSLLQEMSQDRTSQRSRCRAQDRTSQRSRCRAQDAWVSVLDAEHRTHESAFWMSSTGPAWVSVLDAEHRNRMSQRSRCRAQGPHESALDAKHGTAWVSVLDAEHGTAWVSLLDAEHSARKTWTLSLPLQLVCLECLE